jgi:hypothetical protein
VYPRVEPDRARVDRARVDRARVDRARVDRARADRAREPEFVGAGAAHPAYARYGSGAVTRLTDPPPEVIFHGRPDEPDPPDDLARRNRLMLRWFGGAAAGVLIVGVVIVLALVMTGNASSGLLDRKVLGPTDTRPKLAQLCPPPTGDPGQLPAPPSAPPGARTVDKASGISYKAYGAPWQPWLDVWTKGTLHVSYRTGQYFVTERYTDQFGTDGLYLASILSGAVPAATNDAMTLDLQCTGRQVAADVRAEYYPQPNSMETLRDEQTVIGGRRAWVSKFRLHFHQAGLQATDELVAVVLIDVGRPEAAILYVSIPGTHRQYDPVVDEVVNSVRPA